MKKLFLSITILFSAIQFITAQNFNLQFRSEVTYTVKGSSVWGYASGGREYALMGTENGVSIIDVTDPDNPVSLFNVVHETSDWREIKTYSHYAYATNEDGQGILIIDLADLPNSFTQYSFVYDPPQGQTQTTGHTLWIDEKGRMFVFGGNYSLGYACFDLTVDPLNPPFIGKFNAEYIHDGYVRGDTLWASEIAAGPGRLEVLDVTDPALPVSMTSFVTPSSFTHNSWPTHDNHYVFTTDEVDNSYLTSYDVSQFDNVTELDRVQSNPGSNVIIHNVHLYNDQFATVAYYKDGVVIFDVSHPDNMIEVGSYDTDPGESGGSYGGTWGVYPYLPSGNILASDYFDAGAPGGKLTVLTPTWVAACWLEGLVTDSATGAPLNNVKAEIVSTIQTDLTDLSGNYKTGYGIPGNYTIVFSKLGYDTLQINNVALTSGVVTTLNVKLVALVAYPITGQVTDSATNLPVAAAKIFIRSSAGDIYNATTDVNGNYTVNCFAKTYDIFCGKWSYKENGIYDYVLNPGPATINFKIQKGYYDDYILDLGWTITSNAASGKFVRAEPIGTLNGNNYVNPEFDIAGDWGDYCFMTGNGGGSGFTDDVDDGTTTIKSPKMDLLNYADAVVKFYVWFDNYGGQATPKDSIVVYLSDGVTKKTAMFIDMNNFPLSQWNYHEFHVNDFMSPTANMQVTFSVTDLSNSGNVLEAAIDYFKVIDALGTGTNELVSGNDNQETVNPNPFSSNTIVSYRITETSDNTRIVVKDVLGNEVLSKNIYSSAGSISLGENLAEGIYFVSIVNGNEVLAMQKVVKVK